MRMTRGSHYYLFVCILINSIIRYGISQCVGPKTPDELAEYLWGRTSNNTRMSFTRPNVAQLASDVTNSNPSTSAAPDTVSVNVHLLTVKGIEQRNSEFSATLWMRKSWNDYRLSYRPKSQGGCFSENERVGFITEDLEHIWTPDISIQNSVDEPLNVAESFWIYPNGDVEWSVSLLLTLSCTYNFKKFPRDTQVCEFVIGTWKEDASEIQLSFGDDPPITKAALGNALGDTLEWNLIDLNGVEVELWSEIVQDYESYLSFQFTVSRKPEYFIDFVIVPVILMVVLSWASFFIDRASAPARVTMSIICFLTITNFVATQLSSLPRLGMHEIWLLEFMEISMIFTFYSVLEYVTCNYLYRVERRLKEVKRLAYRRKRRKILMEQSWTNEDRQQNSNMSNIKITVNKKDMMEVGLCQLDRLLLWSTGEMAFRDEHIEIFSRWLFPISYAVVLLIMYFSAQASET